MAFDLTVFLAAAEAEQERYNQIIRGLENLSDDHMTSDEATQILQLLELYKRFADAVDMIVEGLTTLVGLGYPTDPVQVVSLDFKTKIEGEEEATDVAADLFVTEGSAVNGPLLFEDPIPKV